MHHHPNIETVRKYLAALEYGVQSEELASFFTSDAVQVELPNRLNPRGGESNLATLLARAEQGRGLLSRQRYEIVSELAGDARVAVEATWSATLAVPLGALAAGDSMRAHFAMFFELVDGKIKTQRNYDCFEPW
jgi:ketosteroid isomerase-like protein